MNCVVLCQVNYVVLVSGELCAVCQVNCGGVSIR